MVSRNNVEWEIVRMVTRIALAMRRMNEAFRHRAKEHDASVLTNGVEALDSKKVAGSPGRRVAGSPGRRVAGSPGRRVAPPVSA